jgi:hypothetical protein
MLNYFIQFVFVFDLVLEKITASVRMFSKILLALGVVLAISALRKKIYKYSVIDSQCLIMFLASNMQLSEKMWEAISFKLHIG